MNNTASSWYPLKNFTKSPIHKDWTMGVTKWETYKDCITGAPIKKFDTVFWNRAKGSKTISLETYRKIVSGGTKEQLDMLEALELPTDIRV